MRKTPWVEGCCGPMRDFEQLRRRCTRAARASAESGGVAESGWRWLICASRAAAGVLVGASARTSSCAVGSYS